MRRKKIVGEGWHGTQGKRGGEEPPLLGCGCGVGSGTHRFSPNIEVTVMEDVAGRCEYETSPDAEYCGGCGGVRTCC